MPRVIQWKGPRAPRRPAGAYTVPQIYSISVSQARLGQAVAFTILGVNFRNCPSGNPPQVYFGDLQATSVVVVDSGTITGVTPVATAAGVVDVKVVVGCCS